MTTGVRTAWHDQFTQPTPEGLLAPFEGPVADGLEVLRGMLAGAGLREHVTHMGIPWRWCFAYLDAPDADPFAHLIPEPGRPQLSLPLPEALIESLKIRRMSKTIRDGLIHARMVGRVVWAEWDITSRPQAEELARLATVKLEALRAAEAGRA